MRKKYFAVLGVAGTLVLAACSSSDDGKPLAKGDSASATNVAVVSSAQQSGNSNTNVVANGAVVIPEAVDANTMAIDSPGTPFQPPQLRNRLEKTSQGSGESGPPVDPVALAMKNARPAPENSTFTSYLTDAGYEIRSFKSHPQLQKVEKRTTNEGNMTVKVFLRNGKVIEVPGQRVPSLSTASSAQIMGAAGLAAPVTKAPGSTGSKQAN